MDPEVIGNIKIWAGSYEPDGYAFCNGQLLQIQDYEDLFELIGNLYGGDGENTFALPDMRGRVGVHPGGGTFAPGQKGGTEGVPLTTDQIPGHSHALMASAASGATDNPENNVLAAPATDAGVNFGFYFNGASPTTRPLAATAVQNTGGGAPHANIMPVLALNYIIALKGSRPSQV